MALLALSIGLISFLKRREEATVPILSSRIDSTAVTVAAVDDRPVDVADQAAVVHVRTHAFSPMTITLFAVQTLPPAPSPKPMLLRRVLAKSAHTDGRIAAAGGIA